MSFYDNRRITFDPGLTVLALRGLGRRDGHYPFIERHIRWRRLRLTGRAIQPLLVASFPTLRSLFARSTPG